MVEFCFSAKPVSAVPQRDTSYKLVEFIWGCLPYAGIFLASESSGVLEGAGDHLLRIGDCLGLLFCVIPLAVISLSPLHKSMC